MNKFTKDVREKLAFMPYAEMLFISAETGQRLPKLFDTIDAVIENHAMRIGTGVLNEILSEAVAMKQPPSDKGRRLRLYYITQVSVKPPTFVIFINDKELNISLIPVISRIRFVKPSDSVVRRFTLSIVKERIRVKNGN